MFRGLKAQSENCSSQMLQAGLQNRAAVSSTLHDLALPSAGPLLKSYLGSREENASED